MNSKKKMSQDDYVYIVFNFGACDFYNVFYDKYINTSFNLYSKILFKVGDGLIAFAVIS